MLAALCHDLDHRGKRVPKLFVEERRAAMLAIRTSLAPEAAGPGRPRPDGSDRSDSCNAFDADQPMDEVVHFCVMLISWLRFFTPAMLPLS